MRLSPDWTTNIVMLLIPTTANAHAAQNPVFQCVSANERHCLQTGRQKSKPALTRGRFERIAISAAFWTAWELPYALGDTA